MNSPFLLVNDKQVLIKSKKVVSMSCEKSKTGSATDFGWIEFYRWDYLRKYILQNEQSRPYVEYICLYSE